MTSDGKVYKLERYKQIVEERYLISKHTNTSYVDLGEINPLERTYLLNFIKDDIENKNNLIKEANSKR